MHALILHADVPTFVAHSTQKSENPDSSIPMVVGRSTGSTVEALSAPSTEPRQIQAGGIQMFGFPVVDDLETHVGLISQYICCQADPALRGD